MHNIYGLRSASLLILLLSIAGFLFSPLTLADDASELAANGHVLKAERAMKRNDFLLAAQQYRMAAEASDDVATARKATLLAFAYEFSDEAVLAANRWVKLSDGSDESRAYLGQIYFRLDDLRQASKQFSRLIKSSEDGPGQALLALTARLGDERQEKRADKLVRSLARKYKQTAAVHYAVAVSALQAGDTDYAKERLTAALKLEPDELRSKLLYARALLHSGDEEGAIEYLAHIIGDSAKPDPDARMELALIYMMTGRDDDALSQVNQVLLENAARTDALRMMAIINFRLERLDAAWDDFQDLLGSGQYRMDALYYLARIADYRQEYERAIRLYREVRYGSYTVFSQRRASALLAHQMEDPDAAIGLLDDFATDSPDNAVEMMVTKAQLLVSLGRYDEGLEIYETAAEYRLDNEGMALGRAELLLRTGRLDDAIAGYRDAAKRWPKSALTLNALGYTLADRTEQYDEAEKLISKALSIDPNNPAIIDSMGWVLFKRGRHTEALEQLEKAYAGFPDQEVAAHIVEVLVALERRDEALERLIEAEEKDAESEMLAEIRERLFPEADED